MDQLDGASAGHSREWTRCSFYEVPFTAHTHSPPLLATDTYNRNTDPQCLGGAAVCVRGTAASACKPLCVALINVLSVPRSRKLSRARAATDLGVVVSARDLQVYGTSNGQARVPTAPLFCWRA